MTNFKPQLCPNEQPDLSTIQYPMLASFKLDGIRCIIKEGELFSRSLKKLSNIHLQTRFEALKEYSRIHNVILDGELYCDSVPFNDLSGIIRSDEQELPEDLEFWCFDHLKDTDDTFEMRVKQYSLIRAPYFHPLLQKEVCSPIAVTLAFDFALKHGFEGLILRNPKSLYKFGRVTSKSNDAYKCKPYQTFDAEIIGIGQATEAREGSEKKVNELGRSCTSQKKEDRILVPMASTFKVMYEGKELEVSIAMTHEEKKEIWANQDKYIGRMLEYKGMLVGAKDLPRHATSIRFRDDK